MLAQIMLAAALWTTATIKRFPVVYVSEHDGTKPIEVSTCLDPETQAEALATPVRRALTWLQSQQLPDGSWQHSPSRTSLALLAYLSHGETPLSEDYGLTVELAMRWLHARMISGEDLGDQGLGLILTTYAVSESYGMTKIPLLRTAMDQGVARIMADGWTARQLSSYAGRGRASGDWLWYGLALNSADIAGADTPDLKLALRSAYQQGHQAAWLNSEYAYGRSWRTMSNAQASLRHWQLQLGRAPCAGPVYQANRHLQQARVPELTAVLAAPERFRELAGHNLAAWFFDQHFAFECGGRPWHIWQDAFERVVTRAQQPEGYWEAGATSEPLMITIFTAMNLTVYYRYLPSFTWGANPEPMYESDRDCQESSALEDDFNLIIQ
jgi:hypothetical protein